MNVYYIIDKYLISKKSTVTEKNNITNKKKYSCSNCINNKENNGKAGKNTNSQNGKKNEIKDNKELLVLYEQICRSGDSCRYKHIKLCIKWEEEGDCNTTDCKLSHINSA